MVAGVGMGDTGSMVDPTPTGPPPGDSPPQGFPPTPPPPVSRPALRLASGDKWLGGVAGGIARTLGIPSWTVRLAFFLLTLFGGIMIFAYLALWFFLPDESGRVIAREVMAGNESWLPVAGVVILALAFGATLGIFGGSDAGILVPAVLVGGGIALLAGRDRAAPIPLSASAPPPGPPPVPSPPANPRCRRPPAPQLLSRTPLPLPRLRPPPTPRSHLPASPPTRSCRRRRPHPAPRSPGPSWRR